MTKPFIEDKYIVCKEFLDRQTIGTISKYLEYKMRRGEWVPKNNSETTIYEYYADPLLEVVLETAQHKVEEVTGLVLVPSYSFTRVYQEGEELKPHIDRPACEISVTVNVATVGGSSKIYLRNEKGEKSCELNAGDAVVYKGCEVIHRREKLKAGMLVVQFMLHYTVDNGAHSSHKFDKRLALGYQNRGEGICL
jgi:hypothetical protein